MTPETRARLVDEALTGNERFVEKISIFYNLEMEERFLL